MKREATPKSRLAAYGGILCIVVIYIVQGWFSPPVPALVSVALGAAAIGLLFLAKTIRESDGPEFRVPEPLRGQIDKLMNVEASLAVVSGLSTIAALLTVQMGASKEIQRFSFCGSLIVFALNAIFNFSINRKYHRLLNQFDGAQPN